MEKTEGSGGPRPIPASALPVKGDVHDIGKKSSLINILTIWLLR